MTHVILSFTSVNNSWCSLEVMTNFAMLKSKVIYWGKYIFNLKPSNCLVNQPPLHHSPVVLYKPDWGSTEGYWLCGFFMVYLEDPSSSFTIFIGIEIIDIAWWSKILLLNCKLSSWKYEVVSVISSISTCLHKIAKLLHEEHVCGVL